jgi:hypothetical protein
MAFYLIKQRGNFTSTASNIKTQAEQTFELSAAPEIQIKHQKGPRTELGYVCMYV